MCPTNDVSKTLESSQQDAVPSYDEFYGIFERKHQVHHFSLAIIAPNSAAMKRARHSHENAHIIFILDGHYALAGAGIERTLPSGSLIFVPAGTTHQNHPQTRKTRILTVSISAPQIERASNYVRMPEAQVYFRHGQVAFLASRLGAECQLWRGLSSLTAEGLCLELLAAVATRNETKERIPPRWLRTAREHLHDRCREKVSISELAIAVGVHPIHLSRTFRAFFHCTPGEYLRDCRVEMAARLLRSENESIAQVALECGFCDQSQMAKAFRRNFRVSPSEFRCANSKHV